MSRQTTASAEVREARGRNLAAERARRGLTLEALGEKVGVSGEQVRKYQIGRDYLGPVWCWRFSQALGCPFGRLFETEAGVEGGVAEAVATFAHDSDEEARLDEVLTIAKARLTGRRRRHLREILFDLLDHEDRAAP